MQQHPPRTHQIKVGPPSSRHTAWNATRETHFSLSSVFKMHLLQMHKPREGITPGLICRGTQLKRLWIIIGWLYSGEWDHDWPFHFHRRICLQQTESRADTSLGRPCRGKKEVGGAHGQRVPTSPVRLNSDGPARNMSTTLWHRL